MNTPLETTISRDALYAMIWQEPTRTVAARLGLSDVGLAKTCRKFHIPRPWRGYWRAKETGHVRRPPKLPPWPAHLGPEPQSIPFRVSSPPDPSAPVPTRPAEPESVQAQRLHEAAHPLITRTLSRMQLLHYVVPALEAMPTEVLAKMVGLSEGYCRRIQAGRAIPKERHWPIFATIAFQGNSINTLPTDAAFRVE